MPGFADVCENLQTHEIAGAGFEPLSLPPAKQEVADEGGAESGAVGARIANCATGGPLGDDPELSAVVAAWPALSEAVRRQVLALVARRGR